MKKTLFIAAVAVLTTLLTLYVLLPLAIKAASVLLPVQGGTGTSVKPTYGQLLLGNAGGTYTPVATSSLGIIGAAGSPGGASSTIQYNANGGFAGSSFFVYTGTNVGIGSTTPTYPLSVNGNIGLSLNSQIIGPTIAADQAYLKFDDAGTGSRLNFHAQFTDFNSSTATRFNGASLEINNGMYTQGGTNYTNFASGASAGTQLQNSGKNTLSGRYWNTSTVNSRDAQGNQQYILTSNSSNQPKGRVAFTFADTEGYSNIEAMSLLNTGNLGIGTTSPYAALSVVGASGVVADHYTATSTTNISNFAAGLDLSAGDIRLQNGRLNLSNVGSNNEYLFSPASSGVEYLGARNQVVIQGDNDSNGSGSINFSTRTGGVQNVATGLRMIIDNSGLIGVGSSTPFARLSIHANANDPTTPTTLFAIGSSTASATTTLFSVDNTGTTTAASLIVGNGTTGTIRLGDAYFSKAAGGNFDFGNNSVVANNFGAGVSPTFTQGAINIRNTSDTGYFSMIRAGQSTMSLRLDGTGALQLYDADSGKSPFYMVSSQDQFGSNIGFGTTSPFAKISIHANNGDTNTTLFAIASSTASATTTLFSISNTGSITTNITGSTQCIHADTNGVLTGTGSDCGSGGSGITSVTADYPFTGLGTSGSHLGLAFGTTTTNMWSNLQTFASGLLSQASSTIGNGNQNGGLTINGGATTTGAANIGGALNITPIGGVLNFTGGGTSLIQQNGNTYLSLLAGAVTFLNGTFSSVSPGIVSMSPRPSGSSGMQSVLNLNPNMAQSGTAGYQVLLINPSEGSVGTGAKYLIDGQLAGADKFTVDTSGNASTTGNIVLSTTGFIKEGSNNLLGGTGVNTLIRPDSSGGKIQFQSFAGGTNAVLGDTGFLGIGTSSPEFKVDLNGTDSLSAYYTTRVSNDAQPTGVIGRKARGVPGTLTALVAGDDIAVLGARGYGATGWGTASSIGSIDIRASENFTDTAKGTYITFDTALNGGTTRSEKMRILNNGLVGVGSTSPFAKFAIHANNGDTNTTLFAVGSSTASATTTLFSISNTGTTTATNGFNITSGCFAVNGVCLSGGGGGGTITGVTSTYPILSTGGTAPVLSLDFGTTTANTWSTLQTFTGLLSQASSTIGGGSQTTGLTISGGATTTGDAYFGGSIYVGIPGTTTTAFQFLNSSLSGNGLIASTTAAGGGVTLTTNSANANEGLTLSSKGTGVAALSTGTNGTVALNVSGTTIFRGSISSLLLQPAARSSSASGFFRFTPQGGSTALPASTEAPETIFTFTGVQSHSNSTIATNRDMLITAATQAFTSFSASNSITDAATVGIDSAPFAGLNAKITNSYGILIGTSTPSTMFNASTSNAYGLGVFAPGGATNNYAAILQGGNVGIGSSSPTAKLSVQANANEAYVPVTFAVASTTASATSTLFSVSNAGLVAVPVTLASCGGIQTNAAGVMSCTSDERLKDVHGSFAAGLNAILAIHPQIYSWKTGSPLYDGGAMYYGFVAQDVQQALPEAVQTNKQGYLQVSQTALLAALINAVKEQNTRIGQVAAVPVRAVEENVQDIVIALLIVYVLYNEYTKRRRPSDEL